MTSFRTRINLVAALLAAVGFAGACGRAKPLADAPGHPPIKGEERTVTPQEYDKTIVRLRALRDSADPGSVSGLLDLCEPSVNPRIRVEAADHLWSKVAVLGVGRGTPEARGLRTVLENAATAKRLLALLDDEESSVRDSGAKILGRISVEDAPARLRRLVESDPDEWVRESARKALAKP